jgi:hypothetical protein
VLPSEWSANGKLRFAGDTCPPNFLLARDPTGIGKC